MLGSWELHPYHHFSQPPCSPAITQVQLPICGDLNQDQASANWVCAAAAFPCTLTTARGGGKGGEVAECSCRLQMLGPSAASYRLEAVAISRLKIGGLEEVAVVQA